MKQLLLTAALSLMAMGTTAQNIDFDLPGKTAPGKDTEVNYISWAVPRAANDSKSFDNGMTITEVDKEAFKAAEIVIRLIENAVPQAGAYEGCKYQCIQ